jgi:hypothetical protein
MKFSTKQFRRFTPTVSKIMTALALAAVLGAASITPVSAKDHDDRHDNGRHNGERHGERHGERYDGNYYSGRRDYYAPPPTYYAPQQSPGISFFLPLDFRR